MKTTTRTAIFTALALIATGVTFAASNAATIDLFKNSHQSQAYFAKSYGYAVFPTIGKAALGVGAAHGDGDVYQHGKHIGRVTMNQLSVGFQAGGQGYSQIIFFEDKHALAGFTSGNFEFSADIGATAITTAVAATAGTNGAEASASTDKHDAANAGGYSKGVAVFTIAKGGLLFNASVGGQKFSYHGNQVT